MNVILFLDLCFVFTPHTCVRVRVHVRVYVCVGGPWPVEKLSFPLIGLQIYIYNFIKKYFFSLFSIINQILT